MSISLFDNIDRKYLGASYYGENTYDYLNRTANEMGFNVRKLLEEWFSKIPNKEKELIKKRLKLDFYATFCELFYHELLSLLKYDVEQHYPTSSTSHTLPDYLLRKGGSTSAYLEIKNIEELSKEERGSKKVRNMILNSINNVNAREYYFLIESLDIIDKKQPSGRRIQKWLQQQLKTLKYVDVLKDSEKEEMDSLPLLKYEDEKMCLGIRLFPVSKEHINFPYHKPVGSHPVEVIRHDLENDLRKALHKKSSKYKKPECPFLIALNYSGFSLENDDILNTLFGSETMTINIETSKTKMSRLGNGFWLGNAGPKNKSISAVLFSSLNPYNIHIANVIIFHNPWANYPYDGELNQLTNYKVINGKLNILEGKKINELIELSDNWPGDLYKAKV